MPFLDEDVFNELMLSSPHFIDCHLFDFNFEEDLDNKNNNSGEIESVLRSSFANTFAIEKDKSIFRKYEEPVIKTIDVKLEITSDSYEWKQGWWIDGFIFEPVLEFK